MNIPVDLMASTDQSRMAILVVPIFLFFWWLEKKNPKKAKKAAWAFFISVWAALILFVVFVIF
jgi:hypothetical protein